jgi:3-oxoacyl-[acyl-carrier-protein] synthase II
LEALGPAAAEIQVSASKSYFGHTLGASGAVESIATLLSLEAGMLPPNLNLERPDPECGIALVGEKPLEIDAELAMKTSFGFGGGNGVLIFRRTADGAAA